MTFVRQFYARWQTLVHEVAKFGVVGAFCYIIDTGLFNAFHYGWELGPLTAKTLSTIIAATVNYFANRHWSFAHRARSGVRREYSLFIALNFVGLAIALVFLAFGRYALHQDSPLATNIWGNVIGTGTATFFRFWAYKKFVFLSPGHPKAKVQPGHIVVVERLPEPVDTPKNVA